MQSFGYRGTVNQTIWAQMSQFFGLPYAVLDDASWKATVVNGQRQITLAPGRGWGQGVMDISEDGDGIVPFPAPSTAAQWHLVAARRNWATRRTEFVVIPGDTLTDATVPTTPPLLYPGGPDGIKTGPGTLDDQPLYWAHVQQGSTIITLFDMRVKAATRGILYFDTRDQMYRTTAVREGQVAYCADQPFELYAWSSLALADNIAQRPGWVALNQARTTERRLATDPPNVYRLGWQIARAETSDGWPANGEVITEKRVNDRTSQHVIEIASGLEYYRVANGSGTGWNGWRQRGYIERNNQSWLPTMAQWTTGNATRSGRFNVSNGVLNAWGSYITGSTTAYGGDTLGLYFPEDMMPASAAYGIIGEWFLNDASVGGTQGRNFGQIQYTGGDRAFFYRNDGATMTRTAPVVPGTGDTLRFSMSYPLT